MINAVKSGLFAATALAIATPVLAEEVNVYSYRQPELIQPMMDAFTAETGIKTNVAFLSKGMIERLQAEGTRTPADVVLTSDISRLHGLVEAEVTQPVNSDILNANIPENLRASNNEWFALTKRARIIYASKDRVAEGDITTYEDLADPKWAGRFCTRSGTHSYNVAVTSAILEHHGAEFTQTWLEGLKSNLARKPQGNDRAQVKAIWAGECDIAIGNTYYMGAMLNDAEQKPWADAVRIEFPEFETGGTHVNVSGIAMTKHAPNPENALALMEFLSGAEAQQMFASTNFEYPASPDVKAEDLVESWGTFETDPTNLLDIAKRRSEALTIIETVDFDG